MEHQESLELYLNLSRRDLQVLCKSNKLPANRSHTELAKSLASFFKVNTGFFLIQSLSRKGFKIIQLMTWLT